MGFDVKKAVNYLISHKKDRSIGRCATYTKKALAAGGLPYFGGDGYSVGPTYEKVGFKRVNLKQNGKGFIGAVAGDICSISTNTHFNKREYINYISRNKDGEVYPGHACMFDGTQWISDYAQGSNAIPYPLNSVKWARVWRWKDIPGDFKIPPEDNAANGNIVSDAVLTSNNGVITSEPGSIMVIPNQYPTHSEYTTYTGTGGNLFETSNPDKNANKLIRAQYMDEKGYVLDSSLFNKDRTRIYSTNDSCIILDELKLPIDTSAVDNWANKGITKQDVEKHQAKLQQQEEEAKKKQEEQQETEKQKSEIEQQKTEIKENLKEMSDKLNIFKKNDNT